MKKKSVKKISSKKGAPKAKAAASKMKTKKVYEATHTLGKVVKIHTKKIEKRGGTILSKEKTKKGTVLKYKF
jgi:hypothetical protein